jgi:hypothetical protein
MSRKRIQKPVIAGRVIGLIAVAGTYTFVVRELLPHSSCSASFSVSYWVYLE